MALRDLVNPITQAYSKSATGFDYGEVRDALKQDRDYKRQQIKSFYDITADLDAAAYSAIKSEIDQVSEKIDKNKLKVNTPEFQQIMGRVRATATGLKETQDLVKKVSQEYAKDPNKFAYISGEQGLEVDEGFEGFMRRMSEASSKKYETPEEYIQGLTSEIGRVQNRVDERLVAQDIQKIISDEIKLAEQATGISEKVPRITIGNKTYVNVPLNIVEALERSKQKAVQMFPNAGLQLAASQRGKGNLEARGLTNEQYMEQAITDMFPTDLLKQYEITQPTFRPQSETSYDRKRRESMALYKEEYKDIKADVKAFQNGDTTAIKKYLPNHKLSISGSEVVFNQIGKDKDGDREVARVSLNDAAAIYQAIANLSKDANMVIEAINAAPAVDAGPKGETPMQAKERESIDSIFIGLNAPSQNSKGEPITSEQREKLRKQSIEKLNAISGVKFIKGGFMGSDKLEIDGKSYDLTDEAQASQANLKIKEKISGKQAESGKSEIPEISSEAEYNNLKAGDKYVWGGKEYTKK